MSLPRSSRPLRADGWMSSAALDLHFQVQVQQGKLVPQVEIEPYGTAFKGQANFTGAPVAASGPATVPVSGLADGKTYHWQARVIDGDGSASPWVPFTTSPGGKPDVGVDQDPPSRPSISSPTNPQQDLWYHNQVVSLTWSSRDALSGIRGYSFVLEQSSPHVIPPGAITSQTGTRLSSLADGVWFLALRAVDRAGNWSPTATYRIQLDRQAPRVSWLSPNRFTFNPYKGPTSVRFTVNKDASVQLGLYRVGDRTPTATYSFQHLRGGRVTSITWTGKDQRGRTVPRGYYFFSAVAVDHASNVTRLNLGGITVAPEQPHRAVTGQILYPGDGKRIIVSLSRQTLYAYDGDRLVLQTYVTTGNPNLPTPPGSYSILAKYSPFEFISPWPQGSPYWYPPSLSHYAMLFKSDGYFLHDAPWRSAFGPGTNGAGQPGTNYGGTHGCVNIPPDPMVSLWNWSPVGTPVDVVP